METTLILTMFFHLVFALVVQSEDMAFPLTVTEQNVGLLKRLSQMHLTPLMGNLKVHKYCSYISITDITSYDHEKTHHNIICGNVHIMYGSFSR